MRFVTYNLLNDDYKKMERLELAIKQIHILKPDVLALQEVDLQSDAIKLLSKALPKHHKLIYSRSGHLQDKEGLAVFSRYSIIESRQVIFDKQQRIAQLAKIKTPDRTFWLANVHMHWSLISDRPRMHQITHLLKNPIKPLIVLGDFNATPDMQSVKLASKKFKSALDLINVIPSYPTPLYRPGLSSLIRRAGIAVGGLFSLKPVQGWSGMIDYIFFDKSFKLKTANRVFDKPAGNDKRLYASDHFGICADLELK